MEKVEIISKEIEKVSIVLTNFGFSYNEVNKMLRNKDIRVDDQKISADQTVYEGQKVTAFCKELPRQRFKIVFEDENVLVVDKLSGIEVEGEAGLEEKIPGAIAVHRLDRNTEGLLVMAKNKNSEELLLKAIKNQKFEKTYLAEVVGKADFREKKYTAFLVKDSKNAQVKIFDKFVQGAVKIETVFKTVKVGTETSVVQARLITGKTHQIRAHLAFLGHAIVGDGKYGKNSDNKKFKEKSQKLHCYSLKLNGLTGDLDYLNGKVFISKPEWTKGLVI